MADSIQQRQLSQEWYGQKQLQKGPQAITKALFIAGRFQRKIGLDLGHLLE